MAKKAKKAKAVKNTEAKETKKGGGVLFAFVSLLSALLVIAVVLAGFLFAVVKLNVLGVADTYRDELTKVPVLSIALPKEVKTDPDEMTLDELAAAYNASLRENDSLKNDIDSANRRIEELSRAKSEFDAQIIINEEKTEQLKERVLALEAEKKKLGDMKYELERAIAAGDKDAFSKHFESVSPEVAMEIYAQIVRENKSNEEQRRFIKLFETIDTKASAAIVETLGSPRIDFICETLGAVKKDIAADIIAKLPPELAAQITLRLSPS